MDEGGIVQAAFAFSRNHPCFPRLFGEPELDKHLRKTFAQGFIGRSGNISGDSRLPLMHSRQQETFENSRLPPICLRLVAAVRRTK